MNGWRFANFLLSGFVTGATFSFVNLEPLDDSANRHDAYDFAWVFGGVVGFCFTVASLVAWYNGALSR